MYDAITKAMWKNKKIIKIIFFKNRKEEGKNYINPQFLKFIYTDL